MKYFKIPLTLTICLLLLISCGSNKKQEDKASETFNIEDYIKAAEAIDPNLNKVDQIFNILEMVEAGYYGVLTNDPYSAHSYKTSYPVAAANMGIYMTDIIYHLYGGGDEEMYLTFAAAQELAKYIGVESKFAARTIESLEGTVMKRDTLTLLFNQLLKDSENYTSDKEMIFVHTAFLTGSFVEKVSISGNLLKQKMNREEINSKEEGNIRELLVIYLNQLDPAASILYDAFVKQQDQLEGLVIINTFAHLKDLAAHLKEMKPALAVAPISELASNEELATSFELISKLRNVLITSSE